MPPRLLCQRQQDQPDEERYRRHRHGNAKAPVRANPVGEDEDSELGNFIENDSELTPSQSAHDNLLREKIEEVLSTLTPREARILRLRFGLQNGRCYTLEEVGQKFGLTRERIRQIEGRALRRLRHPRRARQLRDYLAV